MIGAFPPASTNLPSLLPAYAYKQYTDDQNIVALFSAYNEIASGYLEWFNTTPLGVYVNPTVNGALLDWLAEGIYGIARPVFQSVDLDTSGAFDTYAYNTQPYNYFYYKNSGQATIATDDVYKRVLTWYLYRGDGQNLSLRWLRRRVARFIFGLNGSDIGFDDFAKVGVVSSPLIAPPAPTLVLVSNAGRLPAGVYSVVTTYVTPLGETLASSPSTIGIPADATFYVQSPPWVGGATGYNVYVGETTTQEAAYNMAPLNVVAYDGSTYPVFSPTSLQISGVSIGANWTKPATGLLNGRSVPATNTSVPKKNYIITVPNTSSGQFFRQCVQNGIFDLPFGKAVTVILGTVG